MPLHFNKVSKKEKEGYRLNICFCIYCLVFLAYFAMCPNALQGHHGCWLLIGKLIKSQMVFLLFTPKRQFSFPPHKQLCAQSSRWCV